MIETAAERALFLGADFGTVADRGGAPVPGIFDAAHAVAFGDGLSALAPVFTTEGRHGIAQGDALTIDGARWRVGDVQPDGAGMVRLILEKD